MIYESTACHCLCISEYQFLCYFRCASKVTQELVLANAKAMASSGLIDHGWSFMNIDDVWQGKRGGDFYAILPDSNTFPNMQALCDEVHGLGLKIGIYSTPWVE